MLKRYYKILLSLTAFFLCACNTQGMRMHFADFSKPDFKLETLEPLETPPSPVSLGEVTGVDYENIGEFADYSWHARINESLFSEAYDGFVKLPYENPNSQVRTWLSELLTTNNLLNNSPTTSKVDVTVIRLMIQTLNIGTPHNDYRACFIEMKLTLRKPDGSEIRSTTAAGLAKLPGANMKIIEKTRSQFSAQTNLLVSFTPDDPPICKLAIANALRSKTER